MVDRMIAGIFWILYTIPGNALMFGIVQFDRLGGDPLKRRITDQVKIVWCILNYTINIRLALHVFNLFAFAFICSFFLMLFWS